MLKIIRTEKEYEVALQNAYLLIQEDLLPKSRKSDELELLSLLIEQYEKEIFLLEKQS